MKCEENIKQYELEIGDLVCCLIYIGIVVDKKVNKRKKITYQIYWNNTKSITSMNQIQIIEQGVRKIS